MGRAPRAQQFDPTEVGIVHTTQRCVRRAFLTGNDPVTGKSFEFRREWIRRRLELLSSAFGLDVLTYAILSNHLHLVLRTRPDVVQSWSDEKAATQWLKVFPGKRSEEYLGDPTKADIDRICNDPLKLANIRRRLSDVSWFMKALSEPIARLANRQDECTGRFWEGRFRAQKIVDEAGLLACAMYVDLNPVRAALAASPEQSKYTSAYDRIEALKGREVVSAACQVPPKPMLEQALQGTLAQAEKDNDTRLAEKVRAKLAKLREAGLARERTARGMAQDAWLSPLELKERGPIGPQSSRTGVRASDKGFLSLKLAEYLQLLDWTGRQGRPDKRGKIPASLQPILERIGIHSSMWCDLVWSYQKYFGRSRAAGKPENLKQEAANHHHRWVSGQRRAAQCFS